MGVMSPSIRMMGVVSEERWRSDAFRSSMWLSSWSIAARGSEAGAGAGPPPGAFFTAAATSETGADAGACTTGWPPVVLGALPEPEPGSSRNWMSLATPRRTPGCDPIGIPGCEPVGIPVAAGVGGFPGFSVPGPCMYSCSISAAEASSMASPASSAPFSAGRTIARTCPPFRSNVTATRPAGAPYSKVVTPGAGKVLRISLGTSSAKTPAICCAASCWRRTGTSPAWVRMIAGAPVSKRSSVPSRRSRSKIGSSLATAAELTSNRLAARLPGGRWLEPGDQRDVVRQAMKRAPPEGFRAGEIHPADAVPTEEVVEVHPESEEACGGEAAVGPVDLFQRLLGPAPSHLFRQVPVHRRGRRGVEVASDDERVSVGVGLDEGGQLLGLDELVHAEAHLGLLAPELPGERR